MFEPPDNKYNKFWVDFNLSPGSISIFHVKEGQSNDMWDLLTISQDMVTLPPSILKFAPQSLLSPSPLPKLSSSSPLTPSCRSWLGSCSLSQLLL